MQTPPAPTRISPYAKRRQRLPVAHWPPPLAPAQLAQAFEYECAGPGAAARSPRRPRSAPRPASPAPRSAPLRGQPRPQVGLGEGAAVEMAEKAEGSEGVGVGGEINLHLNSSLQSDNGDKGKITFKW